MAKDQRITFERQGLRLVEMVLAVLIPNSLIGDPLVAWKAQLRETMVVLQLLLEAQVYVPPSIFGRNTTSWHANVSLYFPSTDLAVEVKEIITIRFQANTVVRDNDPSAAAVMDGMLPGKAVYREQLGLSRPFALLRFSEWLGRRGWSRDGLARA